MIVTPETSHRAKSIDVLAKLIADGLRLLYEGEGDRHTLDASLANLAQLVRFAKVDSPE